MIWIQKSHASLNDLANNSLARRNLVAKLMFVQCLEYLEYLTRHDVVHIFFQG